MDDIERVDDGPWSPEEVATIARAVNRAPSVHNTQPWSLSVHDRVVELHQRGDIAPSQYDPEGRDRLISCGAALTNLVLAIRKLGWRAELAFGEDPRQLVSVAGSTRLLPSEAELQRYEAIAHRASHRRPFDSRPVSGPDEEALLSAAECLPSLRARWITGSEEALHLARLLTYAARVQHADEIYQRELASWIDDPTDSRPGGVPAKALGTQGLGAVGLVSGSTHVPDEAWLAARIETESVLLLSTPDDGVRAHLDAGAALQNAWLEATHRALGASVMTQCLQLDEVREGLAQPGHQPDSIQALMRFGHPAGIVPRSSRRPLEEIFNDNQR
ncbi:hypothetical protein EIL87_20280 [Saccharopolyspora rhizosphaerae]|uniref:Nitroreductase domain-containing protein n=1 Tax=Saccharopolyspora rhizosphaerae TaxID=2492662 RepID=A0A3R8Q6B0_9PSEU|nr:nitroreductase family protein [Saccharopolyspora rhizosphaerae]RRO14100.1 hypothetical protein EIL87_20280 [Saccharopolyspora rhizosphaerae]